MNMVEFDRVSKRFVLHHQKSRSLQGALINLLRNRSSEEFWALHDVSFSVRQGESLGLMGQNGSGKSTSLKLISRILEPTSGRVTVNGRVSALLELGAGFHPELTGRENIFLNGSILGLPRKHIKQKFEEIVAFSELERFIDTPIKHYSSGMYVRLGFAVAVTLESDILIVDEVLAVGDEAFRDKCMRKIRQFREEGRTILFVSHVSRVVEDICDRVVLLDDGRMIAEGDPRDMVDRYHEVLAMHRNHGLRTEDWQRDADRSGAALTDAGGKVVGALSGTSTSREAGSTNGAGMPGTDWVGADLTPIVIEDVSIVCKSGRAPRVLQSGDAATLVIRYRVQASGVVPNFRVALYKENSVLVHRSVSRRMGLELPAREGRAEVRLDYEGLALTQGNYYINVEAVHPEQPDSQTYDRRPRAVEFAVEAVVRLGGGVAALPHAWSVTEESRKNGLHEPAGEPGQLQASRRVD